MAIDLRERQFLAQLVPLAAVAGEVDRFRIQKCFIEPVELLLNHLDPAFLLRRPLVRFRPPLFPHVEDPILHEAHVAGRRLQERQLVDERTFEHGSADSDGAALPLTVELVVTQTDPGFKGDTATGGTKPATMETGLVVQVPLFVDEGTKIKINTDSGAYIERVS